MVVSNTGMGHTTGDVSCESFEGGFGVYNNNNKSVPSVMLSVIPFQQETGFTVHRLDLSSCVLLKTRETD